MKSFSKIILVTLLTFLIHINCSSISNKPDTTFYTNTGAGSVIKISPKQDKIIVGHRNGDVKMYSIEGNLLYTFYSHIVGIIDIEWIPDNGPITLDSSGVAIRWSQYGTNMYTWRFNSSVSDMTITYSSFYYIAFNFGNIVHQYYALYGSLLKSYYPVGSQTFKKIQYGKGYTYLFASTSVGYIRTYSCSSAIQQYYTATGSPITAFSLKQDDTYVALTSNNYLYQCSYYSCSYLNYVSSSSVLTYCHQNNFIVTGQNSFYDMDYYSDSGVFQGYLTYMTNYVRSLDCSSNYLVSVDDSGFVAINSSLGFPVWAIVAIVIGSVVVIALIILFTVKKIKARRLLKAQLGAGNQYANINSVPSQPYFNNFNSNSPNQPYSNPPPNVPISNTQYGANQFPSNQYVPRPINFQPKPVQTQNPYITSKQVHSVNPYQTNQPRNWS